MTDFSWESARAELAARRERATRHGGEAAVARQHAAGRRTARERIDELADPGTFKEIGTLAIDQSYDADGNPLEPTSTSYITGLAEVDGRSVVLGADDFTVSGGYTVNLDRFKGHFKGFAEEFAHEYRIPLLVNVEGVGGGVNIQQSKGYSIIPSSMSFGTGFAILNEVPVLAAGMGACAGGHGARLMMSHFSVMTRDTACVFSGGPPVVERALGHKVSKFELGGADVHTKVSGMIDNAADDETDANDQLRRVLSYLPQNVWEMPPVMASDDPVDRPGDHLYKVVPENRRRVYDVHKVLKVIVDEGSFFEIGPDWGKALVTGLARFGGYPVGVLANNPMHLGGAMDGNASDKQTRFVRLCDTFNIPMVFLVDTPGFLIGTEAEKAATLRRGLRAAQTLMYARSPLVTVHMRKAFGLAAVATANADKLCLRLAWPSGEFGDMPVEGGVAAAFRREIEAADDPVAFERKVEAELLDACSPWKTAEAFAVEEMIDPSETRSVICQFIKAAQGRIRTTLGPTHPYIV